MKFDDFDTQVNPEEKEEARWEDYYKSVKPRFEGEKPYFDFSPNQSWDNYADHDY